MKRVQRLLSEAPRDQAESVFTTILRRVLSSEARIVAVMMVDGEGECVDYCSTLPPFETKVVGAHYQVLVMDAVVALRGFSGEVWELETVSDTCTILARRIQEQYSLVLVSKGSSTPLPSRRALDRAAVAIRREAGLSTPAFETAVPRVQVRVRESAGWPYAPREFRPAGADGWVRVHSVLGRWRNWNEELLCFRVRTLAGDELTLAHDDEIDRWDLFDDEESPLQHLLGDLASLRSSGEQEQSGSQPNPCDQHGEGRVTEKVPRSDFGDGQEG